jgi:hypothetical protein
MELGPAHPVSFFMLAFIGLKRRALTSVSRFF